MKVGDGTLGSIRYGRANPTIETLETIARFFELETSQLFCPIFGKTVLTNSDTENNKDMHGGWPLDEMALVQIAGEAKISSINKDTLFIEQDGIPDGGRSVILEPESTEIELTLANAVDRLDP